MHKVSPKRFAQMTGTPLFEVMDRAERGDTLNNIDLGEYGRFDRFNELEEIHVPDRLMGNILPGGVSESSSADAFDAGRTAERQARRNAVGDASAEAGDDGSGDAAADTAPTKGGVLGQALALTGLLGGIIFVQKLVEGSEPGQRRGGTREQPPLAGRVQGPGVRSLST
jgi:hypothetical protein